jgi:hypothetical protein
MKNLCLPCFVNHEAFIVHHRYLRKKDNMKFSLALATALSTASAFTAVSVQPNFGNALELFPPFYH